MHEDLCFIGEPRASQKKKRKRGARKKEQEVDENGKMAEGRVGDRPGEVAVSRRGWWRRAALADCRLGGGCDQWEYTYYSVPELMTYVWCAEDL